MFRIEPGAPLEACLEVNAARAFGLQIGVRPAHGPSRQIGQWKESGDMPRPFTAAIPPLDDGDRLLVAIHLIGMEDDGRADVNFSLMQNGQAIPGSEHNIRERPRSRMAGFYLDYERRGDQLKLVRGTAGVPLDEDRWLGEPSAVLDLPDLIAMQRHKPDRWFAAIKAQLAEWSRAMFAPDVTKTVPVETSSFPAPAPASGPQTQPARPPAAPHQPSFSGPDPAGWAPQDGGAVVESPMPDDFGSPDGATIVEALPPDELKMAAPSPDDLEIAESPLDVGDLLNGGGSDGGTLDEEEPAESSERGINAWMAERASTPDAPLVRDERYTLCINVGLPVPADLAHGPGTAVPAADIPPAGLSTDWVVHSHTAELEPFSPEVKVTRHDAGDATTWTARFTLHVPPGADSDTVRLACIPRADKDVRLQTLVYARDPNRSGRTELYRELDIGLQMQGPRMRSGPSAAVRVLGENVHSPAAHLNLGTSHEWTTPMHVLSVTVLGPNSAQVTGDVGIYALDQETDWAAVGANVAGPIINLRGALERFRSKHEAYLDAVEPGDLDARLASQSPGGTFFNDGDPSPEALAAWETVSRSAELRELALEGRTLYDEFFPPGTELRGWVDELQMFDRLNINCQPRAGTAYVPHVPWGLMYRLDPPAPGEPLDPMGFLGLSLRLGYSAHKVDVPSKALGALNQVHRAFFLYWGDQPRDPTAVEAQWQRARWSGAANQVVVPGPADGGSPKQRLVSLLNAPMPDPTRLLYLYCQCNVGEGNDPVLRFGSNAQQENVVRRLELGAARLKEGPLVFANACTTSSADAFMANELESSFFRRGARAYLGTESKVPIALASRFAAIFFHYFDRRAAPEPMAAGEAVYQARLFLWRHYRNLGGLFYTYVNQYELYMADDEEVRTLRS